VAYRALIVCNYSFPEDPSLHDLQGPKKDGLLLRDALTDHETGMFTKGDVHAPLQDAPSQEILESVEEFFGDADPEDTALFYYSGHGKTLDQQLFLCARNTKSSLLRSTAIAGNVLNEIVEASLAKTKILILDCCYSAMFKGDDTGITELLGSGRYVLAATSAIEKAPDGAQKGLPSPFTKALAEALTGKAEDLNGDGKVDLDDVYRYLKTVTFDGARPHQNFEGSGTVYIAKRSPEERRRRARARSAGAAAEEEGAGPGGSGDVITTYNYVINSPNADVPYLDRPAPGESFSPELVAEFRRAMRDDVRRSLPDSLNDREFLERAGLIQNGLITYAGVLLFSNRPTALVPTAVVQCVRFHGTTNTAPHDATELHEAIPQLIDRAHDFVAGVARIGEAPTSKSARAEPVYQYPMVALREIIANAVVHRDYESQTSNVQIFAFDDRIEVLNPGAWQGAAVAAGERPLGRLARRSQRRNFRIAQALTWSRLFEGLGSGVVRSVEECEDVGAPEPQVMIDDDSVRVTVYPLPPPASHAPSQEEAPVQDAVIPVGRVRLSRRPSGPSSARVRAAQPYVWGPAAPFRNPNFVGRETELQALSDQLLPGSDSVTSRQPPSVLYGLAGVGKTEIAAEYAHRFADQYEAVWWISAGDEDSIRSSLVQLGARLGIPEVGDDVDRAVRTVIETLEAGNPYQHWLLIFDDVTQPPELRQYIPQGGHVLVTSRISEWQRLNAGGREVREFPRADTVRFLRQRITKLGTTSDPAAQEQEAADDTSAEEESAAEEEAAAPADRLAAMLGDLPLAAEHAAGYIEQTGMSVDDYAQEFERNANALLGEDIDMFAATHEAVAATWSAAEAALSPEAQFLFRLLAFFAPEPVAEEILYRPDVAIRTDLPLPPYLLRVLVSRTELRRASRELARFSLLRLNARQDAVQLHRVVQAVTRARTNKDDPAYGTALQATVCVLLAAADPGHPEREDCDPLYEATFPHLAYTGAIRSQDVSPRDLVINQVRRLWMRGRTREALELGETALRAWNDNPDDHYALALAVEVAAAKREAGQVREAAVLNDETLERLRDHYGEDDRTYLICAAGHGGDLRLLGRHHEALDHDASLLRAFERAFAQDDYRQFEQQARVAADLRCVGRYAEALDSDTRVEAALRGHPGSFSRQWAVAWLATGVDLLCLGRYAEALAAVRDVADIVPEAVDAPSKLFRLQVDAALGQALLLSGDYPEARRTAEEAFRRYGDHARESRRATLEMVGILARAERMTGNLESAFGLGESAVALWERHAGPAHPSTLAARADFAVTLRAQNNLARALETNQAALEGFRAVYPEGHPNTAIVMANLASDFAAMGETRRARGLSAEAMDMSGTVLGPRHPVTLAVSANFALDRRAEGEVGSAAVIEAASGLQQILGDGHAVARAAVQSGRIDFDVMPVAV